MLTLYPLSELDFSTMRMTYFLKPGEGYPDQAHRIRERLKPVHEVSHLTVEFRAASPK